MENIDISEFTLYFESAKPRLKSLALTYIGNTIFINDILQDSYIQAITHLYSLRQRAMVGGWLKKIVINNCLQYLRKNKYKSLEIDEHHLKDVMDFKIIETPEWTIVDSVATLSTELRYCVLLRYFSNYPTYEEIAMILDIPIGTVRSRLAAAKIKLKESLHSKNHLSTQASLDTKWNDYYAELWQKFYSDDHARTEMMKIMHPEMLIRFTSGKKGMGRIILENELHDDLTYGSKLNVQNIESSGNISIIEGYNSNSKEFPGRCAPSTVLVWTRNDEDLIHSCHIHDSPR